MPINEARSSDRQRVRGGSVETFGEERASFLSFLTTRGSATAATDPRTRAATVDRIDVRTPTYHPDPPTRTRDHPR